MPTLNLREGVEGKRSGGNEEEEEGIERATEEKTGKAEEEIEEKKIEKKYRGKNFREKYRTIGFTYCFGYLRSL